MWQDSDWMQVLYGVNQRIRAEDVESPLATIRPVKSVCLVCVTGDRGLCGGYNNFAIKKTEARMKELMAMGIAGVLAQQCDYLHVCNSSLRGFMLHGLQPCWCRVTCKNSVLDVLIDALFKPTRGVVKFPAYLK